MSCCTPTIVPFVNAAISTISYPSGLKTLYGNYPRVQIIYYDNDAAEYVVATPLEESRVAFNGTQIIIDHGGNQSGLIKIS